jgi:tetratricopeptide (TPR) repeat protein
LRILIWSFVPPSANSVYWHWLKTGMEAVGHQVIVADAYALAALYGVAGLQQILLHMADSYRVQAAMVLTQNFVEPWFLEALRARGVAVVAFRYDDCLVASPGGTGITPHELRRHLYLEQFCDLSITFSRHMAALCQSAGVPEPRYLTYPYPWQAVSATPQPLRPVVAYSGSPKFRDGAPLSWRVQVVLAMANAGLPLELHHEDWAKIPGLQRFTRPSPELEAFFEIFRTSAVNLSLPADWFPFPYRGVKGLNMEIAAAGGMQLTHPADEFADVFDVGRDLALAETPQGFVQQARYYLDHLDEAALKGRNSRLSMEQHSGWHLWWAQVADLLAEKGLTLDLAAPPVTPSREESRWLCTTTTALAHAYEAKGNKTQARFYFQAVLDLDPQDYAANAGLARLADDPAEACQWWRQAAHGVDRTLPIHLPNPIGMNGTGEFSTEFRTEAVVRWLQVALNTQRMDEVQAAVTTGSAQDDRLAHWVAERLIQLGHLRPALEVLEIGLRDWPDQRPLQDAREQVLAQLDPTRT